MKTHLGFIFAILVNVLAIKLNYESDFWVSQYILVSINGICAVWLMGVYHKFITNK